MMPDKSGDQSRDLRDAQEKLVSTYQKWLGELKAKGTPLLSPEPVYSNPYYSSIPEGWFETARPRILIVGEEGFGDWGCGKKADPQRKDCPGYKADDISAIQQYNYDYLRTQLGLGDVYEVNKTPFWNRIRKIASYGVCCWTNIDKLHRLSTTYCALKGKERKELHSTDVRILREEIGILRPTHMVFLGWYSVSLCHELPELYTDLLAAGTKWKDRTIVPLTYNGIPCLFTYHPGWGNRNKGYGERVDAALEQLFAPCVYTGHSSALS